MNPTLDQLLVALFIVAALGFFLRRALRKRGGKSCGGDCGGGTAKRKPLARQDQ